MTHYIPLRTETGWAVAYGNHRGEFVAVMECATLDAAYREAATMTVNAMRAHMQAFQVTTPFQVRQ